MLCNYKIFLVYGYWFKVQWKGGVKIENEIIVFATQILRMGDSNTQH